MSRVTPVILRGPCLITLGSLKIYSQGEVKCVPDVKSFAVTSDRGGDHVDARYAGHSWKITCTPMGSLQAGLFWPWVPADIGKNAFHANASVVIHSITEGKTITFQPAAITKMPSLILSSRKTPLGSMEISAIGAPTWATTAFSDTSFDPENITTAIYSAALGARSAPYDAIGAREGFEIMPQMSVDEVMDDHAGVAAMIITDIWCEVQFAPNNLSRAQFEELIPLSGSNVLVPGESFTKLNEDLVITGDPVTFTLPNAGCMERDGGFGVKVDGNGNVKFTNRLSVTTGVMDARWTITVN